MKICNCGWTKDSHDFIHEYDDAITVKRDEKDNFYIDANDYKSVTKSGRCTVPFCCSPKLLHKRKDQITESGEIVFDEVKSKIFQVQFINHEFVEGDPYTIRYINFIVPDDTKCNVCGQDLETHTSGTHIFKINVYIDNLTSNDEIYITSKTEKKINWIPNNK